MENRYETRSGDLFVRSWARVRRVSLDRRSYRGTIGVHNFRLLALLRYSSMANCYKFTRKTKKG